MDTPLDPPAGALPTMPLSIASPPLPAALLYRPQILRRCIQCLSTSTSRDAPPPIMSMDAYWDPLDHALPLDVRCHQCVSVPPQREQSRQRWLHPPLAERGAGARTRGGHVHPTFCKQRGGHGAALRRKAPLLTELAPTPTLWPSLLAGKV